MNPSVTVVIGGQYGSEGKGAVIAHMTSYAQRHEHENRLLVIRTGGPQAGHSIKVVYDNHRGVMDGRYKDLPHDTADFVFKMRQVPCAWANPHAILAIGPGALIDVELLLDEIEQIEEFAKNQPHLRGVGPTGQHFATCVKRRLFIDPAACIVTPEHQAIERALLTGIGSTCEGVGAATAELTMRQAKMAKDVPELADYLMDTADLVQSAYLSNPRHIVVESTQGFLLSLRRSGNYPKVTSRDITPAQVLNDAGIPSNWPHRVLSVMRTYPIRVAGPSGNFGGAEITWADLEERTGGYVSAPERTTVTKKIRRVAEWDDTEALFSVKNVNPDGIALTFGDYWWPHLADKTALDPEATEKVFRVEQLLHRPVRMVGLGFQSIAERGGSWWRS